MSFHIEERFTPGPVSKVPVSWFNSVGKFLNNLVGGLGIRVNRDSDPPRIMLDIEKAKLALAIPSLAANTVVQDGGAGDDAEDIAAGAPEAVEQVYMDSSGDADDETDAAKIVRIGVSHFAARADHVHRDPVIHQTRQTLDDMLFIDDGLLYISPPMFDCGGRFIGLDDDSAFAIDIPIDNLDAGSLNGLLSADGSGNISAVSFGTTSGTVAEGDHGHTASDITDWSTATADFLTEADLSGYLTTSDIGTTVAAYSHTHDSLYAKLNHTHSNYAALSHSHGNITAAGALTNCTSADCLLITTTDGLITHSNSNPKASDVASLVSQWISNDRQIGSPFSSSTSGFVYSTNGTISYKAFGTSSGTVAAGNHNHNSAYAALNHNHNSAYAAINHNHDSAYASISTVETLVNTVDSIAQDYQNASDVSSAITTALADYVSATDLANTLADYVTDSDLGEYLEEGDFPSGFLTAAARGASGTITVVTGETWNGTTLAYTKQTVTVSNGLITNLGTSSSTTINTPTVVTWS